MQKCISILKRTLIILTFSFLSNFSLNSWLMKITFSAKITTIGSSLMNASNFEFWQHFLISKEEPSYLLIFFAILANIISLARATNLSKMYIVQVSKVETSGSQVFFRNAAYRRLRLRIKH